MRRDARVFRGSAREAVSKVKYRVPVSKEGLRSYVRAFLGIDVPDKVMVEGHASPMDYLWHCFGGDFGLTGSGLNGDCVVWASRGGGKTMMAAVATLLDCFFKPGCEVRILAGSGEQAGRMYEYLCEFLRRDFPEFVDGRIYKEKCRFVNGSKVEVLTQSAKSVRGQHVQKVRCDEVELFDRDVFEAAQFITKSKRGVMAGLETLSTMHKPYAMMHEAVRRAEGLGTAMFKWSLWEVIERCVGRSCSRCRLWSDCRGVAKKGDGYLKIEDSISMMQRASRAGWESEMLCRRPNLENCVFEEFDPDVHVGEVLFDPDLAVYRAIDFGFVNPFVCLWIQVDDEGVVRVIDEYVKRRASIGVHGENIKRMTPVSEESVAGTFCDPAGAGRNDVTGTSAVNELRNMGIRVRYRRSRILEGIEQIRRAVRDGSGKGRLLISAKCSRLIEAMQCYHYPDGEVKGELPDKDGVHDHYIDALRYFFVNYFTKYKSFNRSY